jgi:hypothetical protein
MGRRFLHPAFQTRKKGRGSEIEELFELPNAPATDGQLNLFASSST